MVFICRQRNVNTQFNPQMRTTSTQVKVETTTTGTQTKRATDDKFTQTSFSFFSDLRDTEQLTCCTGLNSFKLFDAIYHDVKTYVDIYCPKLLAGQSLSCRDQVLLTLMKLKQNSSFTLLSVFFRVARRTCSRIFRRMIKVFSKI